MISKHSLNKSCSLVTCNLVIKPTEIIAQPKTGVFTFLRTTHEVQHFTKSSMSSLGTFAYCC